MDPNFQREHEAVYWDGEGWIPEPIDLRVLILSEMSYVVAREFDAKRTDGQSSSERAKVPRKSPYSLRPEII
jgi:hypothetical protein